MLILGEKLKQLRIGKNLNQDQLGEIMGLAVSTISNYETDKRCPSLEVLIKCARFFHVSADYLLGLERQDYLDISDLDDEKRVIAIQVISSLRNLK